MGWRYAAARRRDEGQLDLFGGRTDGGESTAAIHGFGRAPLADLVAPAGGRIGTDGPTPHQAAGSGGTNGDGHGGSPAALPTGRDDAGRSRTAGLGDCPQPIPLSPAGGVATAEPAVAAADEPSTAEPEPLRNQRNHRITDADKVGVGSPKQKCRHNLAAIELLKQIEADYRPATEEEKRILVRYVGWGGLPQVFDQWNGAWNEERERLEQLLTPDELDSARATTLNAHYTAPAIVRAMYAALERLGFQHGRILEPALGHFIGLMPGDVRAKSLITGVEIDSLTARLAKLLYPDADIRHQPFEQSKLAVVGRTRNSASPDAPGGNAIR